MKYKTPISVIISCYNNSHHIAKAIQSILDQSFKAFELIIINDGSLDDSELQIMKFNDSRIICIKNKKNIGKYSSINIGISVASGKYVCIMDSDTIALPNRLKLQYIYLESHLHVGCLGGNVEVIDENGIKDIVISSPSSYAFIKTWLLKKCLIHQSTMMIRKHLLIKHQLLYNENYRYSGDYDFFIRASKLFPIRNLKDTLIQYHACQISSAKKREKKAIANEIRKKQLKQFNLELTDIEIDLHLKLMNEEYISDSNLKLCEDWCNKLFEANYNLKLFNNNVFYQLLEYSLKAAVKNNSLGGWSIEKDVLNFIGTILSDGDSILEFGSGMGTEALLEKYDVTSIEHNETYCFKRKENHNMIFASINNKWYDRRNVLRALEKEYDLLIIDGPPGELRCGILKNIDLFKSIDTPVIFDDIDRQIDKEVMVAFCEKLDYNYKVISGQRKKIALCVKLN